MDVVFTSIPAYGHLYPLMPLAEATARAGHRVSVATGRPFLDALPFPTDVVAVLEDVVQETVAGAGP